MTFPSPVLSTYGDSDPAAPLVVLLHGRGSDETEIVRLAPHLPAGAAYVAVRAPIAEGSGYAWFERRGIGQPTPESLRETMDWFTEWLEGYASDRPVALVGFSGGAAFAGGLILDNPSRYVAAAILYGTLPFDAGVPVTPGRLAGLPTMVAQGDQDDVIPRELLDRTWAYVNGPSGAPAWAVRDAGGHGISAGVLAELAGWLQMRLEFFAVHGRGSGLVAPWVGLDELPGRLGAFPATSTNTPQEQLTQQSPPELQEELFDRLAKLDGVGTRDSAISVPGARAFVVRKPGGPEEAFLVPQVGEFAHLHPAYDGSLHLALPPALAADLLAKQWGVAHPLAGLRVTPGMVMVFGPRDANELEVVASVVATSHAWATGAL
ncbi:MAG: phospholipase/carboxylesterase [Actinomycetota bacterium]|nr:phospholipase/carboxylesterase [Actinomycetota bacterium]